MLASRWAVGLLALVLAASVARAEVTAPKEALSIKTASGTHAFTVEVMRTPEQRERGLMFRKTMPADQGMLFDFETAAPVMMWMKNTYLPLDMVFIGQDGRVISVAANAEPLSEKVISSQGAALGVLEVNAGTAARIGLKAGDKVENGLFPR